MKLLHLADLHLGKRIFETSLLEEQADILDKILALCREHRPQAVLLAGDVYDKPVPPAEAVSLLDRFLTELTRLGAAVLLISGNHDSPERLAFGGSLLPESGVWVSPVYDGAVSPVTLTDPWGPVHFWLLPFLKPAPVRRCFPEEPIESTGDALRAAVSHLDLDPARRNVLLAHQFVTGSTRSESEEIFVGGSDNVDAAVFAPFDYVALGHLHRPQSCGRETLRYAGSPLKYSFSEAGDAKSVPLVTLGEKGDVSVELLPLSPRHDLVELRGSYRELTLRAFYENTCWREDFTHITLTDEEDVPDAAAKLRIIYRRLLRLDYDNARTRLALSVEGPARAGQQSPLELFAGLYERQNNRPLSGEQAAYLEQLIASVWEGGETP